MTENPIGYCMKCKHKEEMVDVKKAKKDTTRGIKYMLKGKCKVCGGNVICLINETTFEAMRVEEIQ